MWESISNFFGGSDGGYNDAGLEALINANDLANAQYGNDYTQYQTFSDLPSYYDQYYDQSPTSSSVSSFLGNMDLGDVAKLGLGALGAWGSYQDYKSRRDLAEAQMEGDQANRELGAGDDFAKMHALAQIIQARQGINLDPSLAYAQAVRDKMGLSPEGATQFAGVDVGGPMQVGISSADRLDEINRATNVNFAEGGGVFGGGLGRMLASRNPQLMAAMQQRNQRQQQADGGGMSSFLARRLAPQLEARQLQQQRFQQEQMQPRQFGGLSAMASRNPQLMAAMQRRQMLQPQQLAHGGDVQGLLAGGSPGQADDVNASLSHGEYVFDADTVAALGDGNTEAGARELDHMREAIRQHKRSAPASKIPPPSKGALGYLKGVK